MHDMTIRTIGWPGSENFTWISFRCFKMGSSCSWWSSENRNVNVTASECAEPYMDGAWRTGSCMEIYLQHVTKHVHALENGEPKLRNACWIFHRHGFLFFRILNRSLYLYLRLRAMSKPGHLSIPISIRKNEIRWKTQDTALWQKCLISLKVARKPSANLRPTPPLHLCRSATRTHHL